MATIKSFTSLEQSKKLAEILPLESADMCYLPTHIGDEHHFIASLSPYSACTKMIDVSIEYCTPCWSLAALLDVLPEGTRLLKSTNISSVGDVKYYCDCYKLNIDKWFDNPVDACVAMIERLHELNLL